MGKVTGTRDEWDGKMKQAVGDIKKFVGEKTEDRELEAEGHIEHAKGRAKEQLGVAKQRLSDLGED